MKIWLKIVFVSTLFNPIWAQIGGRTLFEFLDISANPRTMGLGGANVSLSHGDVNMFLNNPALLDSSMVKVASLNYSPFFGRTPHFLLTYAHDFGGKIGTIGAGLQYIRYGKIQETDEAGNVIGEFLASDYAFTFGKAFQSQNFQFGANVKFVGSQIASYNAFGIATDLGVSFKHPQKDLQIGLVIANLGWAFKKYLPNYPLKMPFDVRLGVSFKPYKMPFRFSVTAYHLYRWNISYNDPAFATTTDPFTGQTQTKKISFANNLFRHFVFGTEVILHKNFHLRLGYNHLRNQELKFREITALAGFSGGLAFRVKGYEVAFTRAGFARRGLTCLAISKSFE
ncbi:MAG: type IX secretion system protein PorQ [Raineya sp.]|nr:type IX secretion system protein PorQ [Raineya sp.]